MERISKSKPNENNNTLTTECVIAFIRKHKSDFENLYNESETVIKISGSKNEQNEKLTFGQKTRLINNSGSLKLFLNDVVLVRYGNLQTINKMNLSFYSSLLTLLFPNFIELNVDQQKKYIKEFYKIICDNSIGIKKDVRNDLLKGIVTKPAIKYIADYLCVNIFIIDDKTLYYSGNEHIVFFKKNIFMNKIDDDIYEPLMTNDDMYFIHEHILIKNLMNNLSNIVPLNKTNKKTSMAIITEDLLSYIKSYNKRLDELSEKHNVYSENMNHYSESNSESDSDNEIKKVVNKILNTDSESESEKDSSNDEKEIVLKKKK